MVNGCSRRRIRCRCRRSISSTSTSSRHSSSGRSIGACSNSISNTRSSRRRSSDNIRSRSNNSSAVRVFVFVLALVVIVLFIFKKSQRKETVVVVVILMVCLNIDVILIHCELYDSDKPRATTRWEQTNCPPIGLFVQLSTSCCSVTADGRLWSVAMLPNFCVRQCRLQGHASPWAIRSPLGAPMPRSGDRLACLHSADARKLDPIVVLLGVYGNAFEDGLPLHREVLACDWATF